MWKKASKILFCLLLLATACHHVPRQIEPTMSYAVQDKYLLSLPSPFEPLTEEEKAEDWGKEIQIGFGFAHELDLYQAITAFKRAEFLLPPDASRRIEVQYEILLCYYIGKKPKEVIYTFDHSDLRSVDAEFPAFHDLLLILYDIYTQEKMTTHSARIHQLIQQYFPDEAENLALSSALIRADFPVLESSPRFTAFLENYNSKKKSIGMAQGLNALLPGAGYLYLGQNQSAATAFFLNSLFIAASAYFFDQGNIAAGIIFTSFEAGWYFGGIYGAGLEAKSYNERLYENMTTPLMNRERLFPALMLNYAF